MYGGSQQGGYGGGAPGGYLGEGGVRGGGGGGGVGNGHYPGAEAYQQAFMGYPPPHHQQYVAQAAVYSNYRQVS